jgi:hypothetical protein
MFGSFGGAKKSGDGFSGYVDETETKNVLHDDAQGFENDL